MKMLIGYVRFDKGVGSPRSAGTNITKARANTKENAQTPRDELMEEIEVLGPFLVLRAFRKVPQAKGPAIDVLAERWTPLTNVVDFELLPPEPEAAAENKPKGTAR